MTATLSMRDLTRNSKILLEYDFVDIEDKKSHEYKGLFVSIRHAEDVKKFLIEKLKNEHKKSLDQIMQFSGILDDITDSRSFQELKSEKGSSK